MKRLAAILTACLLLAGCAGPAPEPGSAPAQSQSSAQSAEPAPVQSAGLELRALPTKSAVTAEGFYTMDILPRQDGSLCILYGDFASSTLSPLCSVPGCAHNGSECPSWLPPSSGGVRPMIIGEQIFLVFGGVPGQTEEQTEDDIAHIMTMEPDGSSKTLLTRFGPDQQLCAPYLTDDRDLYCTLETTEADQLRRELIRVDLATGEWETLYEMDVEHDEQVTEAFGSCVLLGSQTVDQGKPVLLLNRLDLSTGEKAQVPAPSYGDASTAFRGRQVCYYSLSENALHCLDWITLEDRVLKENLFEGGVGNGFVSLLDCQDGHALLTWYAADSEDSLTVQVDLSSGKSTSFSLLRNTLTGKGLPASILAALPGTSRYLVDLGEEAVDYATYGSDGAPMVARTSRTLYGVINASDYWSSTPSYQTLAYSG